MSDRQGMSRLRAASSVAAVLMLAACGGGGGGSENNTGIVSATQPPTPTGPYTAGVFQPAASFKNQCASPRTGNSAITGRAFPDMAGSVTSENNWLRSWTNDLYLWYSEVPDKDPAGYSTPDYFTLLKTTQITPSGAAKDQFHFSLATDQWESFSQSGTSAGYGAQFFILNDTPPRQVIVAFTEPNSPASAAGLARGDEVLTIDGADLVNSNSASDVGKLNAGLSPATLGESHSFTLRSALGASKQATMTSAKVTSTPVQNTKSIVTPSGNVGYLLFNDHIATAESQLIAVVNSLKTAGVVDLVLDVRYNGGGYLDIASELAYMIAGSSRTDGQTFERIAFNGKHPTTDPVTGESLAPTPFHKTAQGFSAANGTALPTLNLSRVFVLTSADTCSASEAIINGLRGVDVQVIQIGTTTCGKPYGFYPQDNCGTTYFSVQFKGVNAKGFGDYTDGFSPQNTSVANRGEAVVGCSVYDDFGHALGDQSELMLSAALNYRQSSACPTPAAELGFSKQAKPNADLPDTSQGQLLRPQWRETRMMRPVP